MGLGLMRPLQDEYSFAQMLVECNGWIEEWMWIPLQAGILRPYYMYVLFVKVALWCSTHNALSGEHRRSSLAP